MDEAELLLRLGPALCECKNEFPHGLHTATGSTSNPWTSVLVGLALPVSHAELALQWREIVAPGFAQPRPHCEDAGESALLWPVHPFAGQAGGAREDRHGFGEALDASTTFSRPHDTESSGR